MMLNAAIPAFAAQVTFAVGVAPSAVSVADLNRDGKPDLVVEVDGSQQLMLLTGNGDGTFSARQTLGSSGHAAIAIADLNRDGVSEVVVASDTANTVSVYSGNGDGMVGLPKTFTVGQSPRSVAVADFNRDGRPDVAVANYGDNTVSVLAGDGSGSLLTARTYAVGSQPLSIIATDINLDGKPDLAFVNHGGGSLGVLFGNGDGVFQAQRTIDTSPFIGAPSFLAAEALPGSAKPKLAVAGDNTQNMLDVYLGDYPQQVSSILLNAGTVPRGLGAADLNVDGTPDLVVTSATGGAVYVLQNNNQGVAPRTFAVGTNPSSVATADLNGDGRPDLVVTNNGDNTVGVLLGDVPPKVLSITRALSSDTLNAPDALSWVVTFNKPVTGVDVSDFTLAFAGPSATSMSITPLGGSAYTVTVAGVSGLGTAGLNLVDDGSVKDAAGNPLQPGGASVFQAPQTFSAGGNMLVSYGDVHLADLNSDSFLDLILIDSHGTVAKSLLGNGNGTFQAPITFGTANNFTSAQIADVNRDGRPDILVSNAKDGQNAVGVLLGNGDGTFAQALTFAASARPTSVAVGDVNGDGKPDVAVSNYPDKNVGILLGNGDGTLLPQKTFTAGQFPNSLALSDVNRDGKLDMVVTDFLGSAVNVLSGNGDGTFGVAHTFAVSSPGKVQIFDVNRDGNVDVLIGSPITNQLNLLLGNGDGTFQPASVVASNLGLNVAPDPFSVADVNNDGRVDVAVVGSGVLFGNGDGTFTAIQPYPPFLPQTVSIEMGDLNGDGKPDVVQGGMDGFGSRPTPVVVSLGAANGGVTGPAYRLVSIIDQVTLDPNNAAIVRLKADPDGTHIDWNVNGTTFGQCLINDPNGLTISHAASIASYVINLDYGNGNPLPDTLHLGGAFVIAGLQGANPFAGKTLEIGPGAVAIQYTGSPDPVAGIRAALANGNNGGTWTGSGAGTDAGAITSSAAALEPGRYAVGYADYGDGSGVNTSQNTIYIKYTLTGDANLDGKVTLADFNALSSFFGASSGVGWTQGDFNYDGKVTLADFNALSSTFGTVLPAEVPAVAAPAKAVAGDLTTLNPEVNAGAASSSSTGGDWAEWGRRKRQKRR